MYTDGKESQCALKKSVYEHIVEKEVASRLFYFIFAHWILSVAVERKKQKAKSWL